MPGILIIDDDFTGLADGTTISGRTPPVSDSSSTYGVDPNTSGVVGGGSGDIRFGSSGAAFKIQSISSNRAVRATINMNGESQWISIFTRDSQSTPYPRFGYMASFNPNANGAGNGLVSIGISNNYSVTPIPNFSSASWTYSTGINTMALESIGTTHRVIINDVLVTSFTDSTYSNIRVGMVYGGSVPSAVRVNRFSVLDSIVLSEVVSYVIVSVS